MEGDRTAAEERQHASTTLRPAGASRAGRTNDPRRALRRDRRAGRHRATLRITPSRSISDDNGTPAPLRGCGALPRSRSGLAANLPSHVLGHSPMRLRRSETTRRLRGRVEPPSRSSTTPSSTPQRGSRFHQAYMWRMGSSRSSYESPLRGRLRRGLDLTSRLASRSMSASRASPTCARSSGATVRARLPGREAMAAGSVPYRDFELPSTPPGRAAAPSFSLFRAAGVREFLTSVIVHEPRSGHGFSVALEALLILPAFFALVLQDAPVDVATARVDIWLQQFGARLPAYVTPNVRNPVIGDLVPSRLQDHLAESGEPSLFFGFTTLALACAWLLILRRHAPDTLRRAGFVALVLGLAAFVMSLPAPDGRWTLLAANAVVVHRPHHNCFPRLRAIRRSRRPCTHRARGVSAPRSDSTLREARRTRPSSRDAGTHSGRPTDIAGTRQADTHIQLAPRPAGRDRRPLSPTDR